MNTTPFITVINIRFKKSNKEGLDISDTANLRTWEDSQELSDEDYTVEAFWVNKEFRCPECGSPLMTQYVVGSDKTESNFTERICSCRNHSCELDWRIYSTADGHIVKIERFFCG